MQRIEKLLRHAGYVNGFGTFEHSRPVPQAIQTVIAYACQNPGLDYANYGEPTSYRSDSRRITKQLGNVADALRECYLLRVTDADVIAASETAYSGRLGLKLLTPSERGWEVDYTTGQYWPCEYRAACAAVLEEAARIAERRVRVAA